MTIRVQRIFAAFVAVFGLPCVSLASPIDHGFIPVPPLPTPVVQASDPVVRPHRTEPYLTAPSRVRETSPVAPARRSSPGAGTSALLERTSVGARPSKEANDRGPSVGVPVADGTAMRYVITRTVGEVASIKPFAIWTEGHSTVIAFHRPLVTFPVLLTAQPGGKQAAVAYTVRRNGTQLQAAEVLHRFILKSSGNEVDVQPPRVVANAKRLDTEQIARAQSP